MKIYVHLLSVYKGSDGVRKDGSSYKGSLVFQVIEQVPQELGICSKIKNIYYRGVSDLIKSYSVVKELVGKDVFIEVVENNGYYNTDLLPELASPTVQSSNQIGSPVAGGPSLSQRVSQAA